jgi:hypothetical protein
MGRRHEWRVAILRRRFGAVMTRFLRILIPAGMILAIAGCSAPPPPPEASYPPPPQKKQLDAKTQLETGRKY